MNENLKTAVFAGGCFWCTEAVFQRLRGVKSVVSGYAGGDLENPTYYQVMRGDTGHAESIKFEYDPEEISYRDLLEVFFATHDPTTLNQQQYDKGPEYRSIIFYSDEEQKSEAEKIVKELTDEGVYDKPIVTSIEPLKKFFPAEAEHLNFYNNNPNSPYCQIIINPKIHKLKEKFASLLKEE
ncbi:MAG TPA: peptide-methionine (S)-S-oxide reductase MsrA [Patescibacteria group bacterium]|jgi:peptide-methionine (S)-S-oxide reductase|nr:peptide-methionine (S)-S-oxide reductase MsrA [Patescibacteria group bacterium]